MSVQTKFRESLLILSNALIVIPLAVYGYFGWFSRYLADDYCTAGQYLTQGFLPSLQYWHMNWSGRYAFYFFINLTHVFGSRITPFLPAAFILLWWAMIYILVREFLRAVDKPYPFLQTLLFAAIILFATLDGTPDIYQSLYWQTGVVTYVVPLIFFTGYVSWILWRVTRASVDRPRWEALVLSAGITFVVGGFSETYVTMQTTALIVFLIIATLFSRGNTRRAGIPILVSGLIGSLVALIMLVTAPGNNVRIGYMPDRMPIPEMAFWSVRHALAFSAKSILNAPISFLIALLIPGSVAFLYTTNHIGGERSSPTDQRNMIQYFIGIPIIAFILILGTIVPSVFATAAYPAERALITAQYILVCATSAWSYLFGYFLRKYRGYSVTRQTLLWVVILVLIIAGTVTSSQKAFSQLPDAQTFAKLWETRDQNIRQEIAAGVKEISAVSLPHISPELGELSKDPNDWINQCIASTYGLTRIVAK